MKKIFALALIGLFTVAFSDNAIASDNDNQDVVMVIGDYDSPIDAVAFEVVAVVTDFTNNVAVFTVSNNSEGFDAVAVNTVSNGVINSVIDSDIPIDYGLSNTNTILYLSGNSLTFIDLPFEVGWSSNSIDILIKTLNLNRAKHSVEGYSVPIVFSVFG